MDNPKKRKALHSNVDDDHTPSYTGGLRKLSSDLDEPAQLPSPSMPKPPIAPRRKARPAKRKADIVDIDGDDDPSTSKPVIALSEKEKRVLKKQKDALQQDDDFFTFKPKLVFKKEGQQLKAPVNPDSSKPKPSTSTKSLSNGSTKHERSPFKPVKRTVVKEIDLDPDSSSSSPSSPQSGDDDDDSADNARKNAAKQRDKGKSPSRHVSASRSPQARRRKKRSETPIKAAMAPAIQLSDIESITESSSFDSDEDSDTRKRKQARRDRRAAAKAKATSQAPSRATLVRRKLDKNQATAPQANGKGKGRAVQARVDDDDDSDIELVRETASRAKSLTPIEGPDAYLVAHALQDVRRHAPPIPPATSAPVEVPSFSSEDDVVNEMRSPVRGESGDRQRSQSASRNTAGTRLSLDPLPPAPMKAKTEQELNEELGHHVAITVTMIADPRNGLLSRNPLALERYKEPMQFQVRARENFAKLFDTVAATKNVPPEMLVLTHNNVRVWKYGVPSSINLITSASFIGYDQAGYAYLNALREDDRAARLAAERQASIDLPATSRRREQQPGQVIDLDDAQYDMPAATPIGSTVYQNVGSAIAARERGGGNHPGANETVSHTDAPTLSAQPSATATAMSSPAVKMVNLTLCGRNSERFGVACAVTKKAGSLVKHFLKKAGLPATLAPRIVLMFDGEEVPHDDAISKVGFENDDNVDVIVPVDAV